MGVDSDNKENENLALVIQSFGKENEYKRAILTVLSFFAYNSFSRVKALVFTDNPGYFENFFRGLPIEYVVLTPEKIQNMRGKIDFLHRMKIAVIEEAFQSNNGNILYADSDTFFIGDPEPLIKKLSPGKSFMHVYEYRFEEMRELPLPMGKTFHAVLNLIETQSFYDTSGQEINLSPQDISWNAGVIMLHPSHVRFIPDVYALTDQFYPETLNHASEQYAFSILLQKNTAIAACEEVIYHYWYRVKKQIVDLFLRENMDEQWKEKELNEKLKLVNEWTKQLPGLFERHILTLRDNAIQAFCDNKPAEGYKRAIKAFIKAPFNARFLKDVLYHTKTRLIKKQA